VVACHEDFADSFTPQTTVIPGAKSRVASLSGPNAIAFTLSMRMSADLELVGAAVQGSQASGQDAPAFLLGQVGRQDVTDELAADGPFASERVDVVRGPDVVGPQDQAG
jgi:hypothetical protein